MQAEPATAGASWTALPTASPDSLPKASPDSVVTESGQSAGLVRQAPTLEDTPEAGEEAGPDPLASAQGPVYTWQDGEYTRRVRLQVDLVVQPSRENRGDDIVARDDGVESIVRKQPRHEQSDVQPVFRTDSGRIMTLPGGIVVVLDPEWDAERVNRFFSGHGIARSRLREQIFAVNAFVVATDPGLPRSTWRTCWRARRGC